MSDGTGLEPPTPSPSQWFLPSPSGATVLGLLALAAFVVPVKADDLWWHLAAGRQTLEAGLPTTNLYSWSAPEAPWAHHSWLSSVLFYLLHRCGDGALLALGFLLYAAACGLLWKLTRLRGGVLPAALVTALGGTLLLGNFGLRPFLFGNICFGLALLLAERPTTGTRWRPALVLALFVLWANLHGSVLLGLGVLGIYGVMGSSGGLGRRRALDLGMALVGSCATPRGLGSLLLPLDYVREAYSGDEGMLRMVSEWQPLELGSGIGPLVGVFGLLVFGATVGARRAPRAASLGVALAFSFFATQQVRNVPLMALACAPLAGESLGACLGGGAFARWERGFSSLQERSRGGILATGLSLLLGLCLLSPSAPPYLRILDVPALEQLTPDSYPTGLIDHLRSRQEEPPLRLLNSFDWGGALLWELHPRVEVFIDPRNDCYPDDVFEDYIRLRWMKEGWREVLERRQPEALAFGPQERITAELLRDPRGWQVTYRGEDALLFERAGP